MLNAARAQGRPIMVMAMMMAATTQPNAIHTPPRRSQRMFRKMETGGMRVLRIGATRDWAGRFCRSYADTPDYQTELRSGREELLALAVGPATLRRARGPDLATVPPPRSERNRRWR